MDMFPITAKVDMFPTTYVSNSIATTHVETVCLMAKLKKNTLDSSK